MAVETLHINRQKLRETVAGKRKGTAIARHLGVSKNTVNRWLAGEFTLSVERLNQICQFIGVDASEFIEFRRW